MARTHRIPNAAVSARLGAAPRLFGFFQAVRLIEGRSTRAVRMGPGEVVRVGEEVDPNQRSVLFRAAAHLSYPESEIDAVTEQPPDPPKMAVNFIGLTGPLGVLPQHYSVTLIGELRRRNTALRDFFDLFNHRLIAFFYRAWAKYRIPISVERGGAEGADGASETLRALIGFGTDHLSGPGGITHHSLLHYSGLLGHFPRNAVSLEQLLIDYFRLPVKIESFDGRWLSVPEEQRSRFGGSRLTGQFIGLGVDAVIGDSYCDVQGSFSILIGPIGYADFLELMPNGRKLDELAALTRLYVDPQLGFRVELRLAQDEIPKLQLDPSAAAGPHLGWNTWLRHYPATDDARDAGWHL